MHAVPSTRPPNDPRLLRFDPDYRQKGQYDRNRREKAATPFPTVLASELVKSKSYPKAYRDGLLAHWSETGLSLAGYIVRQAGEGNQLPDRKTLRKWAAAFAPELLSVEETQLERENLKAYTRQLNEHRAAVRQESAMRKAAARLGVDLTADVDITPTQEEIDEAAAELKATGYPELPRTAFGGPAAPSVSVTPPESREPMDADAAADAPDVVAPVANGGAVESVWMVVRGIELILPPTVTSEQVVAIVSGALYALHTHDQLVSQ
jgi:hypothetical protein